MNRRRNSDLVPLRDILPDAVEGLLNPADGGDMMQLEECRPEVQRFAVLMERQLRANLNGGWPDETLDYFYRRLKEEVRELYDALCELDRHFVRSSEAEKAVIEEAVDVANFCLFIADILGNDDG